ncbi:hypothetical protein [Herbiconiux solani]|uniref:hypothetical protein n=1 Tax=Herbiconiux solani TaxID=661329 RepID=UPI0012EE718F|nr:hypothetical protein [Herbiconiux solani]
MPRRVDLPSELVGAPFGVWGGRELGVSEKRMRGPDLQRPYHGVRRRADAVARETPEGLEARCDAYLVRLRGSQAFSHLTAAALWGVPLPGRVESDPRIHVCAFGGTRPRLRGVVGHETDDPDARVVIRDGRPVVDAVAAWIQIAALLSLDELVAAADHLVLTPRRCAPEDPRPYVTRAELAARLQGFLGRGRARALAALELVRDGAESSRETAMRLDLVRHGLPEPRLNLRITDRDGVPIGFGDLVYPEFGVVVEYDGEQHRTDSRQYYRDVERSEAITRAGWMHVRATKETPRAGPRSLVARTENALRSRGWHP